MKKHYFQVFLKEYSKNKKLDAILR